MTPARSRVRVRPLALGRRRRLLQALGLGPADGDVAPALFPGRGLPLDRVLGPFRQGQRLLEMFGRRFRLAAFQRRQHGAVLRPPLLQQGIGIAFRLDQQQAAGPTVGGQAGHLVQRVPGLLHLLEQAHDLFQALVQFDKPLQRRLENPLSADRVGPQQLAGLLRQFGTRGQFGFVGRGRQGQPGHRFHLLVELARFLVRLAEHLLGLLVSLFELIETLDARLTCPVNLVEGPQLVEQPVGLLEAAHAGEPLGLDQGQHPLPDVHPLKPDLPQPGDVFLDLVVKCQRFAGHRLLEVLVVGGQELVPLLDRLDALAELHDVPLELLEAPFDPPAGQAVPEPDQPEGNNGHGHDSQDDQQARRSQQVAKQKKILRVHIQSLFRRRATAAATIPAAANSARVPGSGTGLICDAGPTSGCPNEAASKAVPLTVGSKRNVPPAPTTNRSGPGLRRCRSR